jgi:hypothetical protein
MKVRPRLISAKRALIDLACLIVAGILVTLLESWWWPIDYSSIRVGEQLAEANWAAIKMQDMFSLPLLILCYFLVKFSYRWSTTRRRGTDAA